MITLGLGNVVSLPTPFLPEEVLAQVKEHYTVARQGGSRQQKPPMRCWSMSGQGQGQRILVPRGDVLWLTKLLSSSSIPFEVDPSWLSAGSALPAGLRLGHTPRPYQREAVEAMVQQVQGLLVLPPGSGKTFVSLTAIKALGRSALVLVNTTDLLQQWVEEIKKLLGLQAGVIAAGRLDLQFLTVATIQSLSLWSDQDVLRLGWRFGTSVYDEVHSVPAPTFFRVQNLLCCRNRFGLSATPDREDGLTSVVRFVIGPRIYEKTYPELVQWGFLVPPRGCFVQTSFVPSTPMEGPVTSEEERRKRQNRLSNELIRDEGRNGIIVRLAVAGLKAGQTVLVLTNRVAHATMLALLIRKASGMECWPMVGRMPRMMRRSVFSRFRKREIHCVVATQLADYGLDIPHIQRTILAYPIKAKGRVSQRAGRGLRTYVGKTTAEFYDLLDVLVPTLMDRARVRREVYRTSFALDPEVISLPK